MVYLCGLIGSRVRGVRSGGFAGNPWEVNSRGEGGICLHCAGEMRVVF